MSRQKDNHTQRALRLYTAVSLAAVVVLTAILSLLFPFRFNILIFYLIAINAIAFIFYGLDKNLAQVGAVRVPEQQLLILGLAGGTIGSLLGINYLRHKTRKSSYLVKLGIILIIQIVLVTLFMYYMR